MVFNGVQMICYSVAVCFAGLCHDVAAINFRGRALVERCLNAVDQKVGNDAGVECCSGPRMIISASKMASMQYRKASALGGFWICMRTTGLSRV